MKSQLYELSMPQKAIFHTERYYSNTNINNICGVVNIKDEIDFEILKKAMNEVIKNNDAFRLKFLIENNTYKQFVDEYSFVEIDIIDLKKEEDIDVLKNDLVRKTFNILEKTYEFKIFRLPNNTGGYILTLHHIISDGWSLGLISRRVMEAYESLINNTEIDNKNNFSYIEYLENEKEYMNSERLIKDKEYWKEKLNSLPMPITLPTTTKSSEEFSCIAERKLFSISEKFLQDIKEFCQKNHISLFNFFMAVISIYLYKICNSNEFCIGTPILNRKNAAEKNMLGMFINVVPFKVTVDDEENFINFVKDIATDTLGLLRHQRYPYEYILETVREKDSNIPNLYNIAISYQITKTNNTTNYNYTTDWHFNGSSSDDLAIHFYDLDENEELTVAYDYKKLKYTQEFIEEMHQRILEIVKQILDKPEIINKEIEVVTKKEKEKIIKKFNNTYWEYNKNENVIEQFYKIVKENPNKIAIVCNDKKITYDELNKKSNILARHLIKNGIEKKKIIGLMLNRTIEMAVGLLAILKTGCAYLPIDPTYPKERIEYMLENSNALFLLTNNFTENIVEFKNKINISLEKELYEKYSSDNLEVPINYDDLIYLIYTSGSTGKPKGVMLKHINIINFLYGMKNIISFNPEKVMVSVTTICFDIFVLEFWGALTSGMCLILANEKEQNDARLLNELCNNTGANMIQTTPSRFSAFIQNKENVKFLKNMSDVMIGGEALTEGLLSKIKSITKAEIFNMYGPTETAVWSTVKKINKKITIGKPIVNTTCYILDKNKKMLPPYIPGELYIGGDGVSKGYYKKEELTNEKFIKSPFKENEIIYNTGDLAYFDKDGELIHLGRTDFQVKVRGYRIELGEIENKILNIPEITHNVVITDENNRYLICYYTSNDEIDVKKITSHLLKELPNYMIPSYFYKLDKIPLTPNGKLDRKKLPKIDINIDDVEIAKTKTEKLLSKIISEISKKENIDINAPFMTLGLDSLDLIQVQTRLIKYNYILNTQDFFKYNTIKTLANHIDDNIFIYKDDDAQVPMEFRHKDDEILANIDKFTLSEEDLGNVLLTGANGFIGIHLLKELLLNTNVNIYCLVRGSSVTHAIQRLNDRYKFYFKEDIEKEIDKRVIVLNGNVEKENLNLSNSSINNLKNEITTIIHTAAIVKHYGDFQEFQEINIKGTENIANFAIKFNKRLIHLSSISVSGNYLVKQDNRGIEFTENNLYIGQNYSNNVYVHSKFESEKIILEKMKNGLKAQIHRIGILAGRASDGVFQENIKANAFYSRIKSIALLSVVSESMLKHKIEFTPVDECTKAIVMLAKNKIADNKIYHLYNHNFSSIKDIIKILRKFDVNIEVVDDERFQDKILEMSNTSNSKNLLGIINDLNFTDNEKMFIDYNFTVDIKSNYTKRYLSLLKFNWKETTEEYLTKIVSYMRKVDFI